MSYIDDRINALNFGGLKYFYDLNKEAVDKFIRHTNLPADLVNNAIASTIEAAQTQWPNLITGLPISKIVKTALNEHVAQLQKPFKLSLAKK